MTASKTFLCPNLLTQLSHLLSFTSKFFSDIHFCYTLHKDTASTPEIVCCRVPRHCCELLIRRHFQKADAEHRIRCNLCNRSNHLLYMTWFKEWQEFSIPGILMRISFIISALEKALFISRLETRERYFRSCLKKWDFHQHFSRKSDLHFKKQQ